MLMDFNPNFDTRDAAFPVFKLLRVNGWVVRGYGEMAKFWNTDENNVYTQLLFYFFNRNVHYLEAEKL